MIELTKEVKQQVIGMVWDYLNDKFGEDDPMVFGPIVIDPRYDPDDEPYLHIYVVYDGDRALLDPIWTASLTGYLWPRLEAIGIPELPGKSFVKKYEWDEFLAERFVESA